jgi:hypothetical protein
MLFDRVPFIIVGKWARERELRELVSLKKKERGEKKFFFFPLPIFFKNFLPSFLSLPSPISPLLFMVGLMTTL